MKKILLILAVCVATLATANAQELKKGNVTLGATVGYNGYIDIATPGYASDYEIQALEALTFSSPVSVGFEGNWFMTQSVALRFGGGFGYTYKPGYTAVPGTIGGVNGDAWEDGGVPNYRAVGNATAMRWTAYLGVNKYWQLKEVPALHFYIGGQVGFGYSISQIKYDEEMSMGRSLAQSYTGRISFSAGVDYYVLPSMFIGLEVQPVQYAYNVSGLRPQEGMNLLQADSHNISVLAAPTIKIGFKF